MAEPSAARAGEALARHAVAAATVRAFGRDAGAERVVLVVDLGEDGEAVLVEWRAPDALLLMEGEETHVLAPGTAPPARPRDLPPTRAVPATAVQVDPESAELSAPLGALEQLAGGVLGLAAAFGGRSVATADFPTRDEDRPLTVAGRPGEAVILAVGDDQFAMPEGWPANPR